MQPEIRDLTKSVGDSTGDLSAAEAQQVHLFVAVPNIEEGMQQKAQKQHSHTFVECFDMRQRRTCSPIQYVCVQQSVGRRSSCNLSSWYLDKTKHTIL